MTLPYLAYGARNGYGWLNGSNLPLALRERLRKAAGKLPDFDLGEPASCGVVNAGDEVLIYRFMRETSADSRGRAGAYLAMTFFPRAQAANINAEDVLLSPLFLAPVASPSDFFDYTGGLSRPAPWLLAQDAPLMRSFSPEGSLAAACALFVTPLAGVLRIARADPDDGRGSLITYQPPPHPVASPTPVPSSPPTTPLPAGHALDRAPMMAPRGCPWPLCAAVAVLMFLAGILVAILICPGRHASGASTAQWCQMLRFPKGTNGLPIVPLSPAASANETVFLPGARLPPPANSNASDSTATLTNIQHKVPNP